MKARSVPAGSNSVIPVFELILASAIWGFAFVAQRKGNESLHPLFFNALRFAIGSLFLLTLILITAPKSKPKLKADLLLLGCILFIAAALQQIGLLWTSAGSGGFITGLYVVFIPIIGIFKKQKQSKLIILSIFLAVPGLWLINSGASVDASFGNLLVLVSAVFWAMHVQYIDTIVRAIQPLGCLQPVFYLRRDQLHLLVRRHGAKVHCSHHDHYSFSKYLPSDHPHSLF